MDKFQPIKPSPSQIDSLKEKAAFEDHYLFFDIKVALKSDSPEILNFFRQMYKHFIVSVSAEISDSFSYYILAEHMFNGKLLLFWDGTKACALPSGPDRYSAADTIFFSSVVSKVQSHFLIHGAALSDGENAVILSGLTGCGKTTLALELTRRGLRFLSDELAPISRRSHLVDLFPRALGVREGSLSFFGDLDLSEHRSFVASDGLRKCLVDVNDLFEDSMSSPCRAKAVLLLETSTSEDGELKRGHHIVDVALRNLDSGLVQKLRGLDGVDLLPFQGKENRYIVRFRVQKKRGVREAFNKVCEDYGQSIVYRVRAVEESPNPQQEPRLVPIPRMTAAVELLANLQNLVAKRGLGKGEVSVGVSEMLFELAAAIADARCYRLLVGNLEKTADLIHGLQTTDSADSH